MSKASEGARQGDERRCRYDRGSESVAGVSLYFRWKRQLISRHTMASFINQAI
jgi:hypothetical protein